MKRLIRKSVPALTFLGLLAAGTLITARAAPSEETSTAVSRAYLHSYNLPSTGLAMEGYCPVSYFVAGKAVRGKPEYTSTYNGVAYNFALAERKRAFDLDPERYLPAYGGWCAYGMAVEQKFPIDPTAFKIVDDRLLLFLRNKNVDALALWNKNDERAQLTKANAHWAKVSR